MLCQKTPLGSPLSPNELCCSEIHNHRPLAESRKAVGDTAWCLPLSQMEDKWAGGWEPGSDRKMTRESQYSASSISPGCANKEGTSRDPESSPWIFKADGQLPPPGTRTDSDHPGALQGLRPASHAACFRSLQSF